MNSEEAQKFKLAVGTYTERSKAAQNRTQRLEAILPLLEFQSQWRRDVDLTLFSIDEHIVSAVYVVDIVTGGVLFQVRDETTGLRLFLSFEGEDEESWQSRRERIEALAVTTNPDERDGLVDEINAPEENRLAVTVEINGLERHFVAEGGESSGFDSRLHSVLLDLWSQTAGGAARERLRTAIGILALVDVNPSETAGRKLGFPPMLDVNHILSDCLIREGFRLSDVTQGGGPFHYGPLPDSALEGCFAGRKLNPPDPSWKFGKLAEELR